MLIEQGQQVSVIANENLKLDRYLPIFDWEAIGVNDNTVHLLTGQRRLEDDSNDPYMLPEVNKVDIAELIKAVKENLRSNCGVVRILNYGDYHMSVTAYYDVIARILHLTQDMNKLLLEQSMQQKYLQHS